MYTSQKRTRGDRIFRLKTFCDAGHPVHFRGSSFQENMSSLLEFGHQEESLHGPGTRSWSFQLEVHGNPLSYVSLFIVEEMVERNQPLRCQQCSYIGWGHHMICSKRFHFLLPSNRAIVRSNGPNCEVGGKSLLVAMRESRLIDIKGMLMHGVVHSNGFGHLLCVNGIEAGSEILSGCHMLDLWERICTGLGLRKVSLTDSARKGAMDLRLLHGVAYGEPWFARWGYRFARGGYGVTLQMYQRSIEALRGLPLCLLLPHFTSSTHEIPSIIAKYQAMAGHSLVTLGHLFQFMLELKARLPPDADLAAVDYRKITTEPTCRWSTRRLEMAAQVIVEALRRANYKWVSRQDVRDAARAYVGDTGLLDFVLKSLGNHVVGNYVVRRMVNPVTKILEYCVEEVSGGHGGRQLCGDPRSLRMVRLRTTRIQLKRDLLCLYKNVLMEQSPALATGVFGAISTAVRTILDTKLLVKDYGREQALEYEVRGDHHGSINLFCTVLPRFGAGAGGEGRSETLPPYELITLPRHATVGDLKMVVERAFRDMYLSLKTFVAESVVDVSFGDSELVVRTIEPGSHLVVGGMVGGGDREMYEGGDLTVDCACGAKEEDGERMVSCDICGVRRHTRCAGIANGEDVPPFFLCGHCQHDIALLPSFLA